MAIAPFSAHFPLSPPTPISIHSPLQPQLNQAPMAVPPLDDKQRVIFETVKIFEEAIRREEERAREELEPRTISSESYFSRFSSAIATYSRQFFSLLFGRNREDYNPNA